MAPMKLQFGKYCKKIKWIQICYILYADQLLGYSNWKAELTEIRNVMFIQMMFSETDFYVKHFFENSFHITQTCLFKYIENFTTKKGKFSDKNFRYFS